MYMTNSRITGYYQYLSATSPYALHM